MLDSELNSHDSDNNEASGPGRSGPEPASAPAAPVAPPPEVPAVSQPPAAPAALFQAPQVHFQPPAPPLMTRLAQGSLGESGVVQP